MLLFLVLISFSTLFSIVVMFYALSYHNFFLNVLLAIQNFFSPKNYAFHLEGCIPGNTHQRIPKILKSKPWGQSFSGSGLRRLPLLDYSTLKSIENGDISYKKVNSNQLFLTFEAMWKQKLIKDDWNDCRITIILKVAHLNKIKKTLLDNNLKLRKWRTWNL